MFGNLQRLKYRRRLTWSIGSPHRRDHVPSWLLVQLHLEDMARPGLAPMNQNNIAHYLIAGALALLLGFTLMIAIHKTEDTSIAIETVRGGKL
jgi:hypothetical protein